MLRYAITDRALLPRAPGYRALRAKVETWVAGRVEYVQLREKDLPGDELARLARLIAAVVHQPGSRTRLLVNGLAPEVALDCGADGVHLPGGAPAERISAANEVARCVTVSCHTLAEVEAASTGGATAILWAPVFAKSLASGAVLPGTGVPVLQAACLRARPMPVFALGNVSSRNAALCIAAGASGVAGIRLFLGEDWWNLA